MENQESGINAENIGIFNVGALSRIAAKQDAIMHMLAFVMSKHSEETPEQIFERYRSDAERQANIIIEGIKHI